MGETTPTVLLYHCDAYDPVRIRTIAGAAMDAFGLVPRGRVLVKPNLVMAHPELFPHAFTRPEVVDGVLGACRDRAREPLDELALGERSGITVPTRMTVRLAGYEPVLRRHDARCHCFDEVPQVEVPLRRPGRLRDYLYAPEPVIRADFFVNVPKLKGHPWTTITCALKNFIGLQDDRHRLIDHDHRLDAKIVDLQEIVTPKLIVVDAIVAGEGRMLTPRPFPLNLIIAGTNQVAVDVVACRILGVDPATVEHVRLAHERGLGPTDLREIPLGGDVSLDEAARRARGFKIGLERVERFFEGTPIRAHAGPPPAGPRDGYCWGGCPGAVQEAIDIVRQVDPATDTRCRPLTLVYGAYDGPIDVRPGEKVLFVGDCACWKGRIAGESVEVPNCYVDGSQADPHQARAKDIFLRMARVFWNVLRGRRQPYIRARGCPVSVAEQTLYLSALGGTANPYLNPKVVIPFLQGYIGWRLARLRQWLAGVPYQRRRRPATTSGSDPLSRRAEDASLMPSPPGRGRRRAQRAAG